MTTTDGWARPSWRVPVVAWTAVASVLTMVRYLANDRDATPAGVWLRVDGGAYLAIASSGYAYRPSDAFPLIAWFPGYPLAIRAVGVVLGSELAAAVVVSWASGLAATLLFWTWTGSRLAPRARLAALAVLLLYAYGWFLFGTVYSDALFLALALGAFVLADRGRWWPAALVAGAAAGTRPVGIAVGVGLVLLVLALDGVLVGDRTTGLAGRLGLPGRIELRRLRWRHLGLSLVSAWGLLAYSAYLWGRWGSPLLWVDVQEHWSQGPSGGPGTWFKLHMVARMIRVHDPSYIASNLVQLAILGGVVAAIPAVSRRFGLAYAAYSGVLAAMIVIGANELVGAGRYAVGVFPVAALVGELLAPRPRLLWACCASSGIALLVLTVLFSRGAYLT